MTTGSGESNGLVGVRYNATVPRDPLMDVCLTRLPDGETNPLSARARSSEAKFVAKIGVGLLPFISIASVWQKRRPLATNCAAYRRQLTIEINILDRGFDYGVDLCGKTTLASIRSLLS